MSKERVMMKSKIPVKAPSCIPVRINRTKSATVLHPTTVNPNKPSSGQVVTSKEKVENIHRSELSTNKTLRKQTNQSANKVSSKKSVKETSRPRLKVNNSSKVPAKSSKVIKVSTPAPVVKTKVKVQPAFKCKNTVKSHPSQPDIEFVPDDVSRKRILNCIELPPSSYAMTRGQTSIYDRPSLYRPNKVVRPSDPCKALMKTLQSLKIRDKKEAVQNTDWRESISFNRPSVNQIGLKPPDFSALKTLENDDIHKDWASVMQSRNQATFGANCFSLARKTPQMVIEEAKRRFESQKFKEENKKIKKVTFRVSSSAPGKENKCLKESRGTHSKQDEAISKISTPDSKPVKMSCQKDETPMSPLFSKISFKESQEASSVRNNIVKKPVSILKNKEMDWRRDSLFCSRPMRTGLGKMRRSISFSSFPPVKFQCADPSDKLKLSGQQPSPALLRTSISSPEIASLCSSIAAGRPEVQACSTKPYSPARESILKAKSFQKNDIIERIRFSANASGLRDSLFLSNNPREVPESKMPKFCTPVPVSLYPRPQTDSFSPEFLCPRTSNYIIDAPIRTPLVLRNLAEKEENDDLGQVRKKLNFMPPAAENPKQKSLALVSKQNKFDAMVDQECSNILSKALFPYICSQNILNPIAKILQTGDETHFVPVCPSP